MHGLSRIAVPPMLFLASSVLANGAPWFDPQQLRMPAQMQNSVLDDSGFQSPPLQYEDRIAIETETVDVRLDDTKARVQVDYTLRNLTGESLEFQMGFPGNGFPLDDGRKHPPFQSFQVWADGARLSVTPVRIKDETWHIWQLRAPADRRFHVRIQYQVSSPDRFDYVLRTGALWRGPISRLEFRVRFERAYGSVRVSSPGRACREDSAIRWQWTLFEPAHDLHVCSRGCDDDVRTRPISELPQCVIP